MRDPVDIAWVGDCRALLANGTLEQVTTDHTVRKGLRRLGSDAPPPSAEHILTSSLPLPAGPDGAVTLGPGPLFFTSVGVHKSLGARRSSGAEPHPTDPARRCWPRPGAGSRDKCGCVLIHAGLVARRPGSPRPGSPAVLVAGRW